MLFLQVVVVGKGRFLENGLARGHKQLIRTNAGAKKEETQM